MLCTYSSEHIRTKLQFTEVQKSKHVTIRLFRTQMHVLHIGIIKEGHSKGYKYGLKKLVPKDHINYLIILSYPWWLILRVSCCKGSHCFPLSPKVQSGLIGLNFRDHHWCLESGSLTPTYLPPQKNPKKNLVTKASADPWEWSIPENENKALRYCWSIVVLSWYNMFVKMNKRR